MMHDFTSSTEPGSTEQTDAWELDAEVCEVSENIELPKNIGIRSNVKNE